MKLKVKEKPGGIMRIIKFLNEKKDEEFFLPRGYKIIKVVIPDTCASCEFFERPWSSDIDICINPLNRKENDTPYNIIISENGWCPRYKKDN